jgi:hypothetical protein
MYLNVYVPHLQSVGAVVGYLRVHRSQRFASTTDGNLCGGGWQQPSTATIASGRAGNRWAAQFSRCITLDSAKRRPLKIARAAAFR